MKTLIKRECAFAPFVGEFGHLLSHVLPFLNFLHKMGVKIHICGLEIHEVYFYDSDSKPIYKSFTKLRDFYAENTPYCNNPLYPNDVALEIAEYKKNKSKFIYWDILDIDLYVNGFTTWTYHNRFVKLIKYKPEIPKSNKSKPVVALFLRNKGGWASVRGEDWDYQELIQLISPHCETLYITGHPSFSNKIIERDNIKVEITSDNNEIIVICRKANFIITQLSGIHYLGLYTDTKVLLLIKGDFDPSNYFKDDRYRNILNNSSHWELIANSKLLIESLKKHESKLHIAN